MKISSEDLLRVEISIGGGTGFVGLFFMMIPP
jgi:hypothetical protein